MAADPFPFEVLEILGEGAFGAVCVARMTNDPLQRQVAIKVLKQEYASNPKVLQRTRDEARMMSTLHHPNIVGVEQLIEVEGRPVLVMELVRGLDLKSILRRSPYGVPASVAMEVVRQACVALHVAYEEAVGDDGKPMRIIHRDIKPSNMLLSVHGQLKVVDFGIATGQFSGRESRTDSIVMGSRPYMAPERLDRSPDTPGVDIYSAGMSLYEVMTGHVMPLSINPSSHDKSMTEHLDALTAPGMTAEALDDLRRLIRRMCAYDATFRPSARDAGAELGRLIDSMDPAYRITLEAFAREVVEPLYTERKPVPLRVAVKRLEDNKLLTGAIRSHPAKRPPLRSPELHRRPAVFLGGVFGLVAALGGIAAHKLMIELDEADGTAVAETARVQFWFPSDARAQVGPRSLMLPGSLELPSGSTELDLSFNDGRRITCRFHALPGTAVRYVVDHGHDAVSVDDGPAIPCHGANAVK
ncbi:MAG: serine/threonine protein kinase [Alphaproteobacteria bacterium]|nr:serine/threonine protein kinase [Alphaproteobacteria bacterium]